MQTSVVQAFKALVDPQQPPELTGVAVGDAPAVLRAVLTFCRPHQLVSACLLASLCHAPAQAQTAYGVATTGEGARQLAKAANVVAAWRQMLQASHMLAESEKVDAVNRFFNRMLAFADDDAAWGQRDHWATPAEFMQNGRGDCEDFAIAKYVSLRMLGISAERLRLMYVHADVGQARPIAHMVVGFYPGQAGEPLVLDNMIDSVRPVSMRTDLSLVYSFNTRGLWVGDRSASSADPHARLSRWRHVVQRMRGEGTLSAWSPTLAGVQVQVASRDDDLR